MSRPWTETQEGILRWMATQTPPRPDHEIARAIGRSPQAVMLKRRSMRIVRHEAISGRRRDWGWVPPEERNGLWPEHSAPSVKGGSND